MKTRIEKLENGNLRIHLPVALRCREGRRRIVPLATMLTRAWA